MKPVWSGIAILIFWLVIAATLPSWRRTAIDHTSAPAGAAARKPDAPSGPSRPWTAPVPARTEAAAPHDLRGFENLFEELGHCAEIDCGYPQTDPKSYHFTLMGKTAAAYVALEQWVVSEHLESAEVSRLAEAGVRSEDGFVQEAALRVLARLIPRPEALDALLEGVIAGADAQLIEFALTELQRYDRPTDRLKINAALGETLQTGAPFVATEISARLKPFVTVETHDFYASVAGALPEGSVYRFNVEAALEN